MRYNTCTIHIVFDALIISFKLPVIIKSLSMHWIEIDIYTTLLCCWWPEYSPPENSSRKVPPQLFPPRNVSAMKSMHGNNVVWLCAKYVVKVNLFRLESLILMRTKRATNRNNVGGRGTFLGGIYRGGKFRGEFFGE